MPKENISFFWVSLVLQCKLNNCVDKLFTKEINVTIQVNDKHKLDLQALRKENWPQGYKCRSLYKR